MQINMIGGMCSKSGRNMLLRVRFTVQAEGCTACKCLRATFWRALRVAAPHDSTLQRFGGMQGFEGNVLDGGRNVLLHRKIPHILTEVGPAMLRAANSDATAYLQQFVEARRRHL